MNPTDPTPLPCPTPRTDAFFREMQARHLEQKLDDFSHYYHATGETAKYARQLETELAQAQAELEKLPKHFLPTTTENTKPQ